MWGLTPDGDRPGLVMSVAIVTGSGGLIGAEVVRFLTARGLSTYGVDNDMRRDFFGDGASTRRCWTKLQQISSYTHVEADIRDDTAIDNLFARLARNVVLVVHAAAQPSHDWAATAPLVDFSVNAVGTLNLLEATRRNCPEAVFVHCSTNKVYGDTPNLLPLEEHETRWEVAADHPCFAYGIDESMSIDRSKHSLFGVSKCSADLLAQEYGRYFGMSTVCFRCGCITGPGHAGAQLHGFLAFLVKCAVQDIAYEVIGYKGKQVRDNLHALDLANAIWQFFRNPHSGEVYNIGGGRFANCSVIEAIRTTERLTGRTMNLQYRPEARPGDHIWWISDNRRFQSHYPEWHPSRTIEAIIEEIAGAFAPKA